MVTSFKENLNVIFSLTASKHNYRKVEYELESFWPV